MGFLMALTIARLSGLGISHEPTPAAIAPWEVLRILHHRVGSDYIVLCCREQLFWGHSRPIFPGCV